jgi:hypothetical protein
MGAIALKIVKLTFKENIVSFIGYYIVITTLPYFFNFFD